MCCNKHNSYILTRKTSVKSNENKINRPVKYAKPAWNDFLCHILDFLLCFVMRCNRETSPSTLIRNAFQLVSSPSLRSASISGRVLFHLPPFCSTPFVNNFTSHRFSPFLLFPATGAVSTFTLPMLVVSHFFLYSRFWYRPIKYNFFCHSSQSDGWHCFWAANCYTNFGTVEFFYVVVPFHICQTYISASSYYSVLFCKFPAS